MPLTQGDFGNDHRIQTEANPESLGRIGALLLFRLQKDPKCPADIHNVFKNPPGNEQITQQE